MYIMPEFFVLLGIFQVKHWVCDYPLQGSYMMGKFKPGFKSALPLLAHGLVHGLGTAIILILAKYYLELYYPSTIEFALIAKLSLAEAVAHALIDKVKASGKLLGRYKSLGVTEMTKAVNGLKSGVFNRVLASANQLRSHKYFWWVYGLDQGLHHVTTVIILYFIFST